MDMRTRRDPFTCLNEVDTSERLSGEMATTGKSYTVELSIDASAALGC